MKVGDLVRVTYDTPTPTPWYYEMLQTGRPGVVTAVHEQAHGQVCVEFFYDGQNLFAMLENLEVVSENR